MLKRETVLDEAARRRFTKTNDALAPTADESAGSSQPKIKMSM